ncbi:MAG: S8 family serine peptidase [Gammaproteobacteria bacterium]|nr:S8 family serine peptidase [Gammaproteobacteria bacterium]NND47262.1 S8 family serine peptidase [Woeseiaceae bacterium]
MRRFRLLPTCGLLLVAATSIAQTESSLRDAGAIPIHLAGSEDPTAARVYIVQLRAPSAAEHHASQVKAAAPAAAMKPRSRLDGSNAGVAAYARKLVDEQDRVLGKAGPGTQKIYGYQYGLNGFAARMSAAQAQKLENLSEVLNVWEDEIRPMALRYSPTFLGLFDSEIGLRSTQGLDGADIIIGMIDSGVAPEHPMLRDTREADRPRLCRSSWAETTLLGQWLCRRFRKLPDTLVFEAPENWNGACETGELFAETDCNNKLVGARWFIDGALESGPIDDGEIRSARDVDGHGTHSATVAAGNRSSASIFGTLIGDLEGIAPKARVAVYKACWLRPGATRASCNTSDLVNAIDAAVADGVDIISYSIGSSLRRTTAPDDVALMAAAKAGVLSVVAAGNDGPNLGTIGSPAGGPWVITAAASSRDGQSSVEALQITEPPALAGKYATKEANFTPPLQDSDPIEGSLVLVDDDDDSLPDGSSGTPSDACQALVNGDDVSGNIALIQRTGCLFEDMVRNAADAGAIAAVVYNIAGDPIVMNGTEGLSDIPALMIGQADANLVLAELDAGNDVTVVLDKGFLLTTDDTGNVMASFSARGPAPVADILKPDVTAPGINILSGFTPDAANAASGENYAFLSGTSMSTPHVAGVAALLLQQHPDWAPAAIKSALMTTARRDVRASAGLSDANPFDFGAGHIVPNAAIDPGLVFDISDDEFDAFACGTESPAVSPTRCEELAAAGLSFEAAALNQPSIAIAALTSQTTVQRRVTNVSDEADSYSVTVDAPPGMSLDVNPESLSLGPGESADFDITLTYLSGPLDLWRFGSLTWSSATHDVYSPIAVKPASVLAPGEITTFGGTGTASFEVEFGYAGGYSPVVHGLNLPLILEGFVDNDPTKTFSFRSTDGVTSHVISVPADQLYLRFSLFDALTDGDDDLDMYVYYCGADGTTCNKIGESGEPTSEEQFNVFRPAAGIYAVLVHGFETDQVSGGPGANYQLLGWAIGTIDDKGNMSASGPAFVSPGTTADVTINWSGLVSNTIYLGGISHNTPQGLSGLTIITIGN